MHQITDFLSGDNNIKRKANDDSNNNNKCVGVTASVKTKEMGKGIPYSDWIPKTWRYCQQNMVRDA